MDEATKKLESSLIKESLSHNGGMASEGEPEDLVDFDTILAQLLEKIDKPSIKNSLKHSLIINRITSDTLYIITISKLAQLLFSNTENMRYMEEKLKEVMGRSMGINVVFENKENYFARKLEVK